MSFALLPLTCDQALFSCRWVKHSGGEGETKNRAWYNSSVGRLLPTFFIDWHPAKQPIKLSSACTILGMQIFAKSPANVSQKKKMKITGYDVFSRHLHPNLQLEGTRSGIVHGCSVWAETEWKFRTRQGCHVPKYAAFLNPFSFQVVSGNILYAFVTEFFA